MKQWYFLCLLAVCTVSFSEKLQAQNGCTDPLASNYNSSATHNDGSCLYPATSLNALASYPLDSQLTETSGLVWFNGKLWTHNDNSDTNLYAVDSGNGNLQQTLPLNAVINQEWEEITQDSLYFYLGDFGNNAAGNRTDLHILRLRKDSLLNGTTVCDTLWFSWSDQTNFSAHTANTTDFDCEAFVAGSDSLYLFSKMWTSHKTKLYVMPKIPGTWVAGLRDSLDVQGLVTASYIREKDSLVVLLGYSSLLQPFLYLLYDFGGEDFFSANKRKITLTPGFHQTEGIASVDGLRYFLSNEYFSQGPVTSPQSLQVYDLSAQLSHYLYPTPLSTADWQTKNEWGIFPNPVQNELRILHPAQQTFTSEIWDINGKCLVRNGDTDRLDTRALAQGLYFLRLMQGDESRFLPFLHE